MRRSVLARSHSRRTLQGRRLAGSWDATRALVLQTEWGAGPRAHTVRGPQEAVSCPRRPYSPCVPRGALPESGNRGTCSWSPIRTLLRSSPRPSSCGHTLAVGGHTRRGRRALTRRLPPDGFEGLLRLFQDFDVGKVYKKKITLINATYTINHCKLVGVEEHLRDFVHVE